MAATNWYGKAIGYISGMSGNVTSKVATAGVTAGFRDMKYDIGAATRAFQTGARQRANAMMKAGMAGNGLRARASLAGAWALGGLSTKRGLRKALIGGGIAGGAGLSVHEIRRHRRGY